MVENLPKEAYQMFQHALKEDAVSRTRVFERFGCFKHGEMSVEDQACTGHPSTSRNEENVEKICSKKSTKMIISRSSKFQNRVRVSY